jgi:hypothetical protein
MKKVFLIMLVVFLLSLSINSVSAVNVPNYPSCKAPSGELKASYDSGIHGIVGDSQVHKGSDKVYQVTSETLIQCYCPESGSDGIQTNWWKVSLEMDLSEFLDLGWHYIATGSDWGLTSDPYLAKNSSYTCRSSQGSSGGGGGGSVSAAAASTTAGNGSILGYAATGGSQLLLIVFPLGLISLILGLAIRRLKA